MADQKISALTAATTPLGGTEVLPIVQAGVTKKVSVANLTAGRAISATTVSAKALSLSNTGVYTATEQYFDDPGALGNYGNSLVVFSNSNPSSYFQRLIPIRGAYLNQMGWRLTINNAGTEQNAWTADWNGNVTIDTGNLVQGTAAKGVNFTANTPAAGMTSQLLNWYEEGTFTPGLMFGTGTTGITYAGSTAARYVRIGKMVFVTGVVVLTNKGSSTGQAQVTGLPFNVASGADTVCTLRLDAVTFADVWNGVLFGTANKIFLYETTNAGASTDITDADFANNSSVYFNASYIAA